jgi:hypothetical protein
VDEAVTGRAKSREQGAGNREERKKQRVNPFLLCYLLIVNFLIGVGL